MKKNKADKAWQTKESNNEQIRQDSLKNKQWHEKS
jgi:hypothetical protein